MYRVKGAFRYLEYYWLNLWKAKVFFLGIAMVCLLGMLGITGRKNDLTITFFMTSWLLLLYKWVQFFIVVSLPVCFFLLVEAFLNRKKALSEMEYEFSGEGIIFRTEISQRKLSWTDVKGVKEKSFYWILFLQNGERSYIPYHFFENEQHKRELLDFVKERGGNKT